jgi:antitoxin component YwqK of YwqJK toxin-antitoxin module
VGVNVTYFENGKTKLREVVSLNGTIKSEEMNEEGKLVSEKVSRNQVPVGTWKYCWPDGKTMKIKEEYENGLLKRTRLVYYQNGEKQVDETYQFGMGTGLVKNYYEDGKLLSESYYRGKG